MGISKYKESAIDALYHIYNRGDHKLKIFNDDSDFFFYQRRLREGLKKFDFSLICYCLMPNHIHLVLKQNSDIPPSKLISSMHTSYAMVYNKKYQNTGHLFQDRYKQKIIYDNKYLTSLIVYIHFNPVKDKLCKLPKQYRWSSYLEYIDNSIALRHGLCDRVLINLYKLKGLSFKEYKQCAEAIEATDAFDE